LGSDPTGVFTSLPSGTKKVAPNRLGARLTRMTLTVTVPTSVCSIDNSHARSVSNGRSVRGL
jgi:hypothetical protein